MKKKFKFIIIILIVIFIFMINIEISEAGFADFTDEQAEKTTQKMIEEQKQNYDMSKSNNNFLKSLKIEGYEITPEFDKQTLEYYLSIPNNTKEIKVEADADDEKATVEGIGNVKLENEKSEYRIDVTAESGTVRTYLIRINDYEKREEANLESTETNNNMLIENINPNIGNEAYILNENKEHNQKVDYNNTVILLVITSILILLIIFLIIIKNYNQKYKAKRRKK